MSEPTQHMTEAVTQGYCKFPESSMKASRDELDDLKLKMKETYQKTSKVTYLSLRQSVLLTLAASPIQTETHC
jgi:hypothetical protein